MAEGTERQSSERHSNERQSAGGHEQDAETNGAETNGAETQSAETKDEEMRAINERLVIAAVRQQELAEAATRSAESALRSGELYRLLAKNFPGGMVLLFDQDLRHILADGKGLSALGLSKEALEAGTIWERFDPETCRRIEPAYRAVLAGETTVLEVLFPDETSQGKGERVYQVHTLPVRDDGGGILAGMAVAQDVTEQRWAEEAVRWQARHDVLTGLPNRALLRDRLEQVLAMAERSGELIALLFLDLDRFKHVNDTWGHAAGDQLLKAVAARLTGCLRAEDTAARLGGDEFVVVLPGLQAAGDAAKVAQEVAALLASPVLIAGPGINAHEVFATASVGISLFPFDGRNAASLMKHAAAAMYRSKEERHQEERHQEERHQEERFSERDRHVKPWPDAEASTRKANCQE